MSEKSTSSDLEAMRAKRSFMMRKTMPGWAEEPEMVCVFPHPVACAGQNVSIFFLELVMENPAPYSVGKDRRMEAVHDMADELLCAAIVDLFLPAILVENAVETEADVLRLFALHRHVGLVERRHGVGFGRVEDEDAFVEHFEHLAQGPRTPRRLRSRVDRWACRGGCGCIVGVEEGRSGIMIRVEEQSFLL